MLSCPRCAVRIRGNKTSCPLCGGRVQGDAEPSPFPYIPEKKISLFTVIRLSTFIILAVEIVLFALHFLTDFRYHIISLFMLGALAAQGSLFDRPADRMDEVLPPFLPRGARGRGTGKMTFLVPLFG